MTIYKKGDRTDCRNDRGISLLFKAGKMLAKILFKRLYTHITPEVIPVTQRGFRVIWGTMDIIFLSNNYKKHA